MATDPLRISLFLLTLISISRIHQHVAIIGKLRPALLLVAATAGYAFLYPRYLVSGSILRTWPARMMAAMGVIAGLSAIFGISLGNSGKFILEEYSKTLVFGFLLVAGLRNVRDLYTIVLAYALSCAILVYYAQFTFALSQSYGSAVTRLSNLYMWDANDLGLLLTVGLAMTLLLIPFAKGPLKWLLIANTVGIAMSIARSGSRGAFIGLVAVGVGLLLLARTISVARRAGIVVVAVAALAFGAPPGYWEQMRTIVNPSGDYNMKSKDGRKELAKRGLSYMAEYPIFGVGINNFAKAECTISEKARQHALGTGLRCTPPHNTWVQAGAEAGVPGLAAFAMLIVGGLFAMLRLRRQLPEHWARGDVEQRFLYGATSYFALALLGFAVTCTFLTFAWLDPAYILGALMAGLYEAVRDRLTRELAAGAAPMPVAAPAAQGRGGLPPWVVPHPGIARS